MTTTPTSRYLSCAGRELHFTEWGAGNAEAVIAWHGLARTGRDMDDIAAYLAQRYRVICPDTIGRGLSQWSPDPDREYCLGFYEQLAVAARPAGHPALPLAGHLDWRRDRAARGGRPLMIVDNAATPSDWSFSGVNMSTEEGVNTGTLDCSVDYADGKTGTVNLEYVQQDGAWKMLSFSLNWGDHAHTKSFAIIEPQSESLSILASLHGLQGCLFYRLCR